MALVKGNLHEESLPFLDEEKQTSQDKVIGNHKRASLSKFTLFNGVFLIANVAISLLILSHVWPLSSSPRRVVYCKFKPPILHLRQLAYIILQKISTGSRSNRI